MSQSTVELESNSGDSNSTIHTNFATQTPGLQVSNPISEGIPSSSADSVNSALTFIHQLQGQSLLDWYILRLAAPSRDVLLCLQLQQLQFIPRLLRSAQALREHCLAELQQQLLTIGAPLLESQHQVAAESTAPSPVSTSAPLDTAMPTTVNSSPASMPASSSTNHALAALAPNPLAALPVFEWQSQSGRASHVVSRESQPTPSEIKGEAHNNFQWCLTADKVKSACVCEGTGYRPIVDEQNGCHLVKEDDMRSEQSFEHSKHILFYPCCFIGSNVDGKHKNKEKKVQEKQKNVSKKKGGDSSGQTAQLGVKFDVLLPNVQQPTHVDLRLSIRRGKGDQYRRAQTIWYEDCIKSQGKSYRLRARISSFHLTQSGNLERANFCAIRSQNNRFENGPGNVQGNRTDQKNCLVYQITLESELQMIDHRMYFEELKCGGKAVKQRSIVFCSDWYDESLVSDLPTYTTHATENRKVDGEVSASAVSLLSPLSNSTPAPSHEDRFFRDQWLSGSAFVDSTPNSKPLLLNSFQSRSEADLALDRNGKAERDDAVSASVPHGDEPVAMELDGEENKHAEPEGTSSQPKSEGRKIKKKRKSKDEPTDTSLTKKPCVGLEDSNKKMIVASPSVTSVTDVSEVRHSLATMTDTAISSVSSNDDEAAPQTCAADLLTRGTSVTASSFVPFSEDDITRDIESFYTSHECILPPKSTMQANQSTWSV